MGLDTELFVHPERISSQLICPICTQVLDRPVQTPTEHLFCEDELLEWMTRSQLCPITNTSLEPMNIKKPGRIIMNMLNELERYCPNRNEGCSWIGNNDQVVIHTKTCSYRNRDDMSNDIAIKDALIHKLKLKMNTLIEKCHTLQDENNQLKVDNDIYDKKLKVYDAFFSSEKSALESCHSNNNYNSSTSDSGSSNVSSLARINRLRNLTSLLDEADNYRYSVDSTITTMQTNAYDIRGGKK